MKSKTKLTISFAALILGAVSLNAANESFNGSVSTKYTSDYARRGALLSEEAVQARVGFSSEFSGVDVFGNFQTNQSTASLGGDTDELTLGVGTSFMDNLLNTYLGVYNTDHSTAADSDLEGFVSISLNTALTPTIAFYQNTDESLQTFEGQLTYSVDLDLAMLDLGGTLGSTDTLISKNETYTGLTAKVSRTINDQFNVFADVALSDTESRNNETVWGIGLNVTF
ncbi:MAG: hypothetical protein CMO74_14090 [Verrucomicrobiales bacterium]|nr:hypothetical protein [Verrucomicrobiales bacterium]|tara:strand:+ start:43424 stop:44101 length:678 start_codon:yes stop_codon:yes gene_type:complete